MNNQFLFNICGNPFETTLAALRLFFSGTFETWPGLTLLLAHAGGTVPLVAGRAVHASRHAAGFDEALGDSSEILGRFYYDTILHDPKALRLALDVAGPDRFALGSDYPFPMWLDDPLSHLDSASDQTESSGLTSSDIKLPSRRPLDCSGFRSSAPNVGQSSQGEQEAT